MERIYEWMMFEIVPPPLPEEIIFRLLRCKFTCYIQCFIKKGSFFFTP